MNPSAVLESAPRKAPPHNGAPASSNPPATTFQPVPPTSIADAGLTDAMVDTLIFKYLLTTGSASGAKIAAAIALPHPFVVQRLADLKHQQLVGYVGTATLGDFTYTLNESGRDRARRLMDECMYIGAAPVSLADYCKAVRAQSIALEKPDAVRLRAAFHDLLVNDQMLSLLGPAINSGRGMFLYGFPGNGKSSIAERITLCFGTDIYIPRAIHIEGFIVKLFDGEIHEEIPTTRGSIVKQQIDERWVRIKRPTVIVGGELTMDQLEVRYNPNTRTSEASMQLKSNCGTLLIDDFGRQRMNPFELLNRWIVPLEKRFDFLALANGQKIEVPFDQLLIFATNLEPRELVDEAFLRRIPYKINIVDPTEDEFRQLFQMMCRSYGFAYDDGVITKVIEKHYRAVNRPFRCCQPRDLLTLVRNRCQFRGEPLELTEEALDFAASVYFTVM